MKKETLISQWLIGDFAGKENTLRGTSCIGLDVDGKKQTSSKGGHFPLLIECH